MGSAVRILTLSQNAYYRDYRFADFWIHVKKAPLTAVERIARLPGVAEVEPRIVFDVIVDVPNVVRPLTGRLLSTPARGFADTINGVCLVRGAGFSDDRNEEIILSEAFAQAHGLDPGDRVELILNRKRQSFVIAGTAISPEYTYMVRGEGDILPDPEHFGVLYLKEDYARDVLDFRDACNEIVGHVVPGTEHEIDFLLDRITRELEPYGVLSTTPRERHASHRFLADEIEGGKISSTVIPGVFLLVAALVLNVLMSRLAERQRTIIGTLKAIGYSDRQVLIHFVSFGLVVGLLGGLAGNALGIGLAWSMVEMYKNFYQFPSFVYEVYPDLLLIGILISIAFAVGGTLKGVWTVLKLQPADAMRQKPPERGGSVFLERWPWLWRQLGFRTHIALRNLVRNRFRTTTGILATAFATALILMSLFMYDSLWYLVDFQYERIVHSDIDIGMRDEKSVDALLEARRLPAVDMAEPVLGLTCDLRNGRYARRIGITGLSQDHQLTTPILTDLTPIDIPPHGLVMARKLAEILHVDAGSRLELTPVRGRRDTVPVRVASVVDSFIGLDCYADMHYLSSLVGESAAVNAVQMRINSAQRADLYRTIKEIPNAQGLNVSADAKANIESTFVKTMAATFGIIILFAGMIAFGSIVNNALVDIGDQLRDISTFRVLGYQPSQIAAIFFRQNIIIFLVGMTLAVPLSYGLTLAIAQAYNQELFRMPVVTKPATILWSALIAFAFVLLAQAIVYRQIHKLDWLEGIKIKE
jgi:putative ABC transport system permease protein